MTTPSPLRPAPASATSTALIAPEVALPPQAHARRPDLHGQGPVLTTNLRTGELVTGSKPDRLRKGRLSSGDEEGQASQNTELPEEAQAQAEAELLLLLTACLLCRHPLKASRIECRASRLAMHRAAASN